MGPIGQLISRTGKRALVGWVAALWCAVPAWAQVPTQEPTPHNPVPTLPPSAPTPWPVRDTPTVVREAPLPGRESPIADILEPRRERRSEIETDRDSFTPAVRTVDRGRLIVESAYSFIDNRGTPETHSFPELLFRYGVNDWLELRLGCNYEVGSGGNDVSGSVNETGTGAGLERESTLNYGFKVLLMEQDRWLPASVFIVQGFTPTSGTSTATDVVTTSAAGWELPNRWKLDTAFRYSTGSETGDHFDILAPSAVLKAPIGEKWNVHAEYFGLLSHGKAQDFVKHYFSPGVHYLVTRDLEVGVRVGWGLNDQAARFFSNAGVGWQF